MFGPIDRALATALEGKPAAAAAALRELAARPDGGALADRERLAGALALAAGRLGVEGAAVAEWRRALHAQAVRNLLLDDAAAAASAALAVADIPWLPLKGYDLATRVYAEREERRTGDLDLLVPETRWREARVALRDAGFGDFLARDPQAAALAEDYLAREGYAWQCRHQAGGVLVELHVRLWGSAPASLAPALLDESTPDPTLGATARRASLEHAYLVAAFHFWLDDPPRPLGPLRDLVRLLATDADLPGRVVEAAGRHGLAAPVALASALAGELFASAAAAALAATLRAELRGGERKLPVDPRLGLRRLALARLLAGRSSRHGWRLVARAVWPHAAQVAASTPARWPWPLRRLWYVCQRPFAKTPKAA